MKKKYLIIFQILLSFHFSIGQNQQLLKTMSYSARTSVCSVETDSTGNIYIAGNFSPPYHGSGPKGIFLSKYSSAGILFWNDTCHYESSGIWYACLGISVDKAGNTYITGALQADSNTTPCKGYQGSANSFVSKFNSDGQVIWVKQICNGWSKTISVGENGLIYVGGECNQGKIDSFTINGPGFIAVYEKNGSCIKALSTDGAIYSVTSDARSNYFYFSHPSMYQNRINKCDSNHNLIWSHNTTSLGGSIKADKKGNCYFTGQMWGCLTFGNTTVCGSGQNGYGAFICRINPSGQFDLVISADSTAGYGIDIDDFGNIYSTCPIPINPPIKNLIITKYDAFGNIQKTYAIPRHANYWYEGRSIKAFNDVIYVAGYTSSECMLGFLAKISEANPIGIKETKDSELQNEFNVFPNPTGGILNIKINNNNETVSIELTNTLGQIVWNKKINDKHSAFDISHLPHGIYFVIVKQNSAVKTLKLLKQ